MSLIDTTARLTVRVGTQTVTCTHCGTRCVEHDGRLWEVVDREIREERQEFQPHACKKLNR